MMNSVINKVALAGLVVLSAGGAAAAVSVTFPHPETYQDLPFSPTDREAVLKQLGEHFAWLGKQLPAGRDLKVEVLDLDMAGRMHPHFRGGQDVRVLRGGADWPHMVVRYSLESNGRVIASGQDNLSDMNYLAHINRYADGDMLRYEKRMIDDWFKKKFVVRHG